ncbi:MAG: hypothetical protein AAF992_10755 [Bacteroidota bacterium]
MNILVPVGIYSDNLYAITFVYLSMSYTEKYIVETYAGLMEGLSPESKIELIESLAKSLKSKKKTTEKNFYQSFGAFVSDKSAKEIAAEIKTSRKFRKKEIKL